MSLNSSEFAMGIKDLSDSITDKKFTTGYISVLPNGMVNVYIKMPRIFPHSEYADELKENLSLRIRAYANEIPIEINKIIFREYTPKVNY